MEGGREGREGRKEGEVDKHTQISLCQVHSE